MKKLFFLSSFLCIFISLTAQEIDWVKQSSSISDFTNHSIYSIEEFDGDFYLAGDFRPDITFDDVNFSTVSESADAYILRINSKGEAISFWHFESSGYVRLNKIIENPISESLIVTGYFNNDMTYDDNYWESDFITNGFIMSIDKDGTLNWFHDFQGQNEVSSGSGDGLAVDKDGNIYVGIESFGELKIGDQQFSFEQETSGVIIAKFDKDGLFLAADNWTGISFEGIIDITELIIDESNDLVIVGAASGEMEIQGTNYSFSEITTQPFIVKKDVDLNFQWLKTFASQRCHVLDILVDGNDMILSMQYNEFLQIENETITGTGSYGEMAVVSLDVNANLNWLKNFTLTENSGISGVYGRSIIEWNDAYYVGGMYQGDVVHEGELILDNTENISYQYPFVLSLDKEGKLISVYDFVGSNGIGKLTDISANESTLVFGGDFSQHLSVEGTIVTATNSALFYAGLSNGTSNIIESNDTNLISVYPTQSNDEIMISSELISKKIQLISATGSFIKEVDIDVDSIDIQDLQSGMYYLIFETEIGTITKEFIKV